MELTLRFASWISLAILFLLKPYFWICNRSRSPKIPLARNSLLNISAVQLAKQIRHGAISSEYVVEIYINRIKEVNPFINSVVDNRFNAALMDARQCDKMLAHGEVTITQLESRMPFFGVPITVKESCRLKGLSYTGGTLLRKNVKAENDSVIVQKMKAAGAIPLCVTNTPELCSGYESDNRVYGTTRNPYDGRHSAGGSSGGEGSLIGAGASLVGIGSDIAGSIRLPALFNGVFGHKPTPGIIPIQGHFPTANSEIFQKYLVLGPIARYVEDLHAAVKVMADFNEDLHLDEPVNLSQLKIFYMEEVKQNYGIKSVDREIQAAIRRAALHFKSHNAKVTEAVISKMSDCAEIGILSLFNVPDLPEILIQPNDSKGKVNPLWEFLKAKIGCSIYSNTAIFSAIVNKFNGFVSPSQTSNYFAQCKILESELLDMLGDDGVFFFPTFPTPAPLIGEIIFQGPSSMYCLLSNILGLPATHVPMGLNCQGLPIGFQVIAGPKKDRLCLAVAKELERVFGGWTPPSGESS